MFLKLYVKFCSLESKYNINSELNAKNRIAAINILAVPVLLYSYGIIDWKLNEIQDLDKMARKQLCMNRMLAKKVDVDRIYLPCQEGGRSLMNLEKEYKATMAGLHKYMMNKEDSQIQVVKIQIIDSRSTGFNK